MVKIISIGLLGGLIFFTTVGSLNFIYNDEWGFSTYQKKAIQEKENTIPDEAILIPTSIDTNDAVRVEDIPPQETETTETGTMESEPQGDLSCQTSGSGTYALDTDGNHAYGYYVPSTSNPNVLEWSIEVEEIPSSNSYWFFAFNFIMDGTFRSEQPQVGGYAGFQTDGQDHLAIFSVWGADTSEGSSGLSAVEIYEDGSVNRILGKYSWQVGQKYNFRLVKNPENMILYINGSKVGTHYLPADYPDNFYSRISLFVEWFGASKANFPICVSFSNFNPSSGSLYPGTTSQENPLKLNIHKFGDSIKFSR